MVITSTASLLKKFAKDNNLKLTVRKTNIILRGETLCVYFARVLNLEIKKDHCLLSAHGQGETKTEAIKNLYGELVGETVVLNAYALQRKVIENFQLVFI